MRGQAWPLLITNRQRISAQLYEAFRQYTYADLSSETSWLIKVDIPRTFPDLNNLFQ